MESACDGEIRQLTAPGARLDPNAARWDMIGAALTALAVAGLSGGVIGVAAQEASPQASPAAGRELEGKYIVVRLRQPNPKWDVAKVMELIGEGYVPLVRAIPGFVAYIGSSDPTTDNQVYIGIFSDKAGADESTRIAGDWLKKNSYDFFTGDPEVVQGTIGVGVSAAL